MQKKIIFMGLVVSLLCGFAGGALAIFLVSPQVAFTPLSFPSSSFTKAETRVTPAVVSIVEYIREESSDEITEVGGGTGFLVDASGLALTNRHVVSNEAHFYYALFGDGTLFDVEVLSTDPLNDIALVRLSAKEGSYAAGRLGSLPFVTLGDSSALKVGDPVMAIGNALSEYANTVTVGIVSATGRQLQASDAFGRVSELAGLLQTDAAINLGNSGGPLVNLQGEVVGVNTALDDEANGIGFSIPINDVKPALESFRLYGEIRRPILGLFYVMLTPSRVSDLGLSLDEGALVATDPHSKKVAVVEGGPADMAGVREGDVVVSVDGISVTVETPLSDLIAVRQVGEEVSLKVFRDGVYIEIRVALTNAG